MKSPSKVQTPATCKSLCPRCGGGNRCKVECIAECWCAVWKFPAVPQVPQASCYCTKCALALGAIPTTEAPDSYTDPETGYLVFTAAYHTRRGYCCENNCRHCPYPTK